MESSQLSQKNHIINNKRLWLVGESRVTDNKRKQNSRVNRSERISMLNIIDVQKSGVWQRTRYQREESFIDLVPDLFPYLSRCFIIDSKLKKGAVSDYSEEFGKVYIKFFTLLDASEVFDILPDYLFSDCFDEPLSENLLGLSDHHLILAKDLLESTRSEEVLISFVLAVDRSEQYHQYLLGLYFGDHENIPNFIGQNTFFGTLTYVLHAHEFLDGSDCVLLEVVIETSLVLLEFFLEGTVVFRAEIGGVTHQLSGSFALRFDGRTSLALILFLVEDIIGRKLSRCVGS